MQLRRPPETPPPRFEFFAHHIRGLIMSTDTTRRVEAFLDGRTDGVVPVDPRATVAPEVAEQIANRAEAVDWFHALRTEVPNLAPEPSSSGAATAPLMSGTTSSGGSLVPVAEAMLDRAVEQTMYQLLAGPSGNTILTGVDSQESTARRRLAKKIVRQLLGTERLGMEWGRLYWHTVSTVIRRFLRRWAEAQNTGYSVKETPGIEVVNPDHDSRSVVFPKMEAATDWIATDDRWNAAFKTNPKAAEVFAVRAYAGLSFSDIADLTGLTLGEAEEIHRKLAPDIYVEIA
jgi:hypothetical protein